MTWSGDKSTNMGSCRIFSVHLN